MMPATRSLPRALVATVALVAATALAACSGDDRPSAEPTPTSTTTAPAPPPPPRARPAPRPDANACYRLDYDEAVAPTTTARPVPCTRRHTSATFAVGTFDAVVGGHLLAVDSEHVQHQVAATCPARFAAFVGGDEQARQLTMLRPVWFTPTVQQSDAGASWYRCDVIAVASDGELAPLSGRLRGVLDTEAGRARYGMCGTAEPGTSGFHRVICSRPHSWRAIATVPLDGTAYPGAAAVRERGQQPCEDAARSVAANALDFKWGYEWPTARQWRNGQHHGICWAPS